MGGRRGVRLPSSAVLLASSSSDGRPVQSPDLLPSTPGQALQTRGRPVETAVVAWRSQRAQGLLDILSSSSFASKRQSEGLKRLSLFPPPRSPTGPNFKPVATTGELLGPLTDNDTDWACESNKGFRTETQSWYSILADGSWTMYQIIYSITGSVLLLLTHQESLFADISSPVVVAPESCLSPLRSTSSSSITTPRPRRSFGSPSL